MAYTPTPPPPTNPNPTSYEEISKNIEDRVKADLMMKIQEFDVKTEFDTQTTDEKNIKYEASREMSYPDFAGLLN